MEYRSIGDVKVSLLGMGNMRLPETGRIKKSIDTSAAQEIIDYAMAHGVNYYDTAYVYHGGQSETFLGNALQAYPRDSYYLATKYLLVSTTNYKKTFEKQLAKLKTDHIDFYLIHSVMDATWKRYIKNGSIDYFLEQQKEGRIGQLGFSAHCSVENLKKFADHHPWDFVQLQLNYYDWVNGTAKAQYEAITSRGYPIVVMEPLRGGKLMQGKSKGTELLKSAHPDWNVADWAFRWLKRLDGVSCILSGMNSLSQIQQNVDIFDGKPALTNEEATLLLQTADMDKGTNTVPCTGCRYCIEDDTCPQSIDIPYYLDVYNAHQRGQRLEHQDVPTGGTPKDCIACGAETRTISLPNCPLPPRHRHPRRIRTFFLIYIFLYPCIFDAWTLLRMCPSECVRGSLLMAHKANLGLVCH